MNILLVTETYLPFISGVSSSSDSIARFMVSRGHTVTVASPKAVIAGDVPTLPGLSFITAPSVRDPLYAGKPMTVFPFGFPVIYGLLRSNTFDVVHIQEPGSLGISALCAAKIHKVPTVGALHFTPDQVARMTTGGKTNRFIRWMAELYIRCVYRMYDAIMVPTQTFVDFLHDLGVHTRTQVVSNGVHTDVYTPPNTPRSGTKQSMQILYIGRRIPRSELAKRVAHVDSHHLKHLCNTWFYDAEPSFTNWGPVEAVSQVGSYKYFKVNTMSTVTNMHHSLFL